MANTKTPLASLRDQLIQKILKGTREANQKATEPVAEGAAPITVGGPTPGEEEEEATIEDELDEKARPGSQVEKV